MEEARAFLEHLGCPYQILKNPSNEVIDKDNTNNSIES